MKKILTGNPRDGEYNDDTRQESLETIGAYYDTVNPKKMILEINTAKRMVGFRYIGTKLVIELTEKDDADLGDNNS